MTDKGNNLIGSIDITPNTDFDNGVNFGFYATAGTQGKDLISSLPDYFRSNPVTYSLEILISESEQGQTVVATLEGLKEMISAMVPGAKDALEQGVSVKFRHVGNSVFIDVSLEGMFAEMVKSQMSAVKLDLSGFSESGEFNVISGVKLNNPLDIGFEELLKNATQFKVLGKGQMPSKVLFDSVLAQVETQFSGLLPSKFRLAFKAFKLLGALRRIEYTSKYDNNVMYEYIRELAGRIVHNIQGGASMDELNHEMGVQIIGSQFAQVQEKGKSQLDVIKQTATMFLEPYLDTLRALNLDEISMSLTVPEYDAQIKFKLALVGITEFIRNNILN
jgi:hypothetical protein